jgi:hypothetical protein
VRLDHLLSKEHVTIERWDDINLEYYSLTVFYLLLCTLIFLKSSKLKMQN